MSDSDATVLIASMRLRPQPKSVDPDATVIRTRMTGHERTMPQEAPTVLLATLRAPLALQPGFRLHEYRIDKVLGQGGFGITYLATDVHLNAQVAVKEYLPEAIAFRAGDRSVSPNASAHRERYQQGLSNFLVEARTLATFRHPNIVRVARFFEAHRTAYMVLEYEHGQSLRQWWPEHRTLGEAALVERLQPLLDGLSVVHDAGFLHRDIKPDNIQVRAADGRFVLLDFGSAGQTVAMVDPDAVVVTPGYAPIEQYGFGEQGAWTDIYALGATLYWLVGGKKPPDAEARVTGAAMPSAFEVGQGRFGEPFLHAIDWALQSDPMQRPRSIAQWRTALLAGHLEQLALKDVLSNSDGHSGTEVGAHSAWPRRLGAMLITAALPPRWPLTVKLTLAMLATALLPMLATAFYNLGGSLTALEASQLGKVELIAHNTAGRLAQLLDGSRKLARMMASDDDFTRWLAQPDPAGRQPLHDKLMSMVRANADVREVLVVDAAGSVRLSSNVQSEGSSLAAREHVRQALGGQSHTTGLLVDSMQPDAAGVAFAEPLRDAAGQPQGALVLRLRAAAVSAILDEVRHESDLMPFLIDADGVLVAHPRQDLMFRSLMALDIEALARIRADRRFQDHAVTSLNEQTLGKAMVGATAPGHVSYRSTMSGEQEIAGFAPVDEHHWVVGVSKSRAAFEAPLDRLYDHLLWSVALVGLLFSGLALRFARGIVQPIRALTQGALALKQGDFERAHVDVKGRDELGTLARTFNVMTDVLRQRERERSLK